MVSIPDFKPPCISERSPFPVGVVDTNQAYRLPPYRPFVGINQTRRRITLTPHVLGEILLRKNPHPTLKRLCEYEIQFGLEISAVHAALSQMSESDIVKFEPFLRGRGDEHRQRFYSALDNITEEHQIWARKMKAGQRAFCKLAVDQVHNERKSRGPKIDCLEEVLESPDVVDMVVETVTDGGRRQTTVPPERLYHAVMANPYVGRLWRSTLYTFISWQRRWRDQFRNFDPSDTRDDFTDMTLPFWASSGDVVLTEDTKLIRLVSVVEPGGAVTCSLATSF